MLAIAGGIILAYVILSALGILAEAFWPSDQYGPRRR